jgi:predicted ferric reductase
VERIVDRQAAKFHTYIGFAVPMIVGFLVLSYGHFKSLPTIIAAASALGILQAVISLWSVIGGWVAGYSYATTSVAANSRLALRYEELASYPPEDLSALQYEYKKIAIRDEDRQEQVERVLGQDGLLRWHRRLAPSPISLLAAHAVLITAGYAQAARTGPWHEAGTLILSYPDILTATVGLALMCLAGVISVRAIRRRVRREVWWTVHLYLYLALAISFAHILVLGPSFVGHPLTRLVWSAAWAATAGLVLAYRVGLPVLRSVRHGLRVAEVRPEGPGVVSVICQGRHLDRLPVSGGQFLFWRFLTRGLWWQAHPYTLSALPRPPYLRLTVKGVGDHSAALARLEPGTRVAIEGPYGVFTRHSQRQPRVLLIAAGICVTSVRALLEDLPRDARPVVVLRATRREDLVLSTEIADLVKRRDGRLFELTGDRTQASIDPHSLLRAVPDLAQRDVYVCGPEGFVTEIIEVAQWLGVPDEAIHHEAYAL